MREPIEIRWSWVLCALCLGFLATSGCGSTRSQDNPASPSVAYRAAVQDARDMTEGDVYRHLRAILPEERGLVWEGAPGESSLLVVTWTQWDGYDEFVGQEMPVTRPVWVTLAPELQELCRHHFPRGRRALTLRLEQWLGLPPGDEKTRFVELWVDTKDLLRPCRDPQITDRECSLEAPLEDSSPSDYGRWFEEQSEGSYGSDGYPWTRLGYTYDWGGQFSVVGLSEYLIWPQAEVRVRAVSRLREFCRPR